jgi:glycosyltransferase involved in cell wall biosynthesis
LVHDYLIDRGGAERVLLSVARAFPNAPIFTAVYRPESTFAELEALDVRPMWTSRIPASKGTYRALLAAYVIAFERLTLNEYDIVISDSSGFAKNAGAGTKARVTFCHTPPRFVWPCGESSEPTSKLEGFGQALMKPWLKRMDLRGAARVNAFAANSKVVQARIKMFYGRDSEVIHPPINISKFPLWTGPRDGYLLVGRLKSYKGFRAVVEAFGHIPDHLVVVGDGADEKHLRQRATPNVSFRGYVTDKELAQLYQRSTALIVPGEEDWGMTSLEANACGTPVIAAARGGSLESVIHRQTGLLYEPEDTDGLVGAIRQISATEFDPTSIRAHAEQFDEGQFKQRLTDLVDAVARTIGFGTC